MLWTIAIILLVLWALGMVTASTLGGFIHILLVVAIIAVLIRLLTGRLPFASKRAASVIASQIYDRPEVARPRW